MNGLICDRSCVYACVELSKHGDVRCKGRRGTKAKSKAIFFLVFMKKKKKKPFLNNRIVENKSYLHFIHNANGWELLLC